MSQRTYRSELRQAQAAATRERIVEALVAVMARGVEAVSIPAVAREAGVSIGSVYRHFGDKKGLLDALIPYVAEKTGIDAMAPPESVEGFRDLIHTYFSRLDETDDLMRAALASSLGRRMRTEFGIERVHALTDLMTRLAPDVGDEDMIHLGRVTMMLTTSDALTLWKDRLGLSAEEAADEAYWVIETLIAGASK